MNLENKKNCIIIHGCPGDEEKALDPETRTYDKHWIPWTKEKLIEQGIQTTTPLMPTPWAPMYEEYKKVFEKLEVNENSILIGHSCGSAFLVRWLGETKQKINKLILVAPSKVEKEIRKGSLIELYEYKIDETIPSRVNEIVMFTANDESDEGKESLKVFHYILGGKIINLSGHGHYTMGNMGTIEFPELIDVILR